MLQKTTEIIHLNIAFVHFLTLLVPCNKLLLCPALSAALNRVLNNSGGFVYFSHEILLGKQLHLQNERSLSLSSPFLIFFFQILSPFPFLPLSLLYIIHSLPCYCLFFCYSLLYIYLTYAIFYFFTACSLFYGFLSFSFFYFLFLTIHPKFFNNFPFLCNISEEYQFIMEVPL